MTNPPLGEALRRLEEIVRRLEDEDLALEEALHLFEEGSRHLRVANAQLAEAETRVMQVLRDADAAEGVREVPLDD